MKQRKGVLGRKEVPVSYVSRPVSQGAWSPGIQDELEKSLEQAEWKKAATFIEGRAGEWTFKAFGSGMDKNRSCEVMASGKNVVLRLPPHLAEKGFKLAQEKAA